MSQNEYLESPAQLSPDPRQPPSQVIFTKITSKMDQQIDVEVDEDVQSENKQSEENHQSGQSNIKLAKKTSQEHGRRKQSIFVKLEKKYTIKAASSKPQQAYSQSSKALSINQMVLNGLVWICYLASFARMPLQTFKFESSPMNFQEITDIVGNLLAFILILKKIYHLYHQNQKTLNLSYIAMPECLHLLSITFTLALFTIPAPDAFIKALAVIRSFRLFFPLFLQKSLANNFTHFFGYQLKKTHITCGLILMLIIVPTLLFAAGLGGINYNVCVNTTSSILEYEELANSSGRLCGFRACSNDNTANCRNPITYSQNTSAIKYTSTATSRLSDQFNFNSLPASFISVFAMTTSGYYLPIVTTYYDAFYPLIIFGLSVTAAILVHIVFSFLIGQYMVSITRDCNLHHIIFDHNLQETQQDTGQNKQNNEDSQKEKEPSEKKDTANLPMKNEEDDRDENSKVRLNMQESNLIEKKQKVLKQNRSYSHDLSLKPAKLQVKHVVINKEEIEQNVEVKDHEKKKEENHVLSDSHSSDQIKRIFFSIALSLLITAHIIIAFLFGHFNTTYLSSTLTNTTLGIILLVAFILWSTVLFSKILIEYFFLSKKKSQRNDKFQKTILQIEALIFVVSSLDYLTRILTGLNIFEESSIITPLVNASLPFRIYYLYLYAKSQRQSEGSVNKPVDSLAAIVTLKNVILSNIINITMIISLTALFSAILSSTSANTFSFSDFNALLSSILSTSWLQYYQLANANSNTLMIWMIFLCGIIGQLYLLVKIQAKTIFYTIQYQSQQHQNQQTIQRNLEKKVLKDEQNSKETKNERQKQNVKSNFALTNSIVLQPDVNQIIESENSFWVIPYEWLSIRSSLHKVIESEQYWSIKNKMTLLYVSLTFVFALTSLDQQGLYQTIILILDGVMILDVIVECVSIRCLGKRSYTNNSQLRMLYLFLLNPLAIANFFMQDLYHSNRNIPILITSIRIARIFLISKDQAYLTNVVKSSNFIKATFIKIIKLVTTILIPFGVGLILFIFQALLAVRQPSVSTLTQIWKDTFRIFLTILFERGYSLEEIFKYEESSINFHESLNMQAIVFQVNLLEIISLIVGAWVIGEVLIFMKKLFEIQKHEQQMEKEKQVEESLQKQNQLNQLKMSIKFQDPLGTIKEATLKTNQELRKVTERPSQKLENLSNLTFGARTVKTQMGDEISMQGSPAAKNAHRHLLNQIFKIKAHLIENIVPEFDLGVLVTSQFWKQLLSSKSYKVYKCIVILSNVGMTLILFFFGSQLSPMLGLSFKIFRIWVYFLDICLFTVDSIALGAKQGPFYPQLFIWLLNLPNAFLSFVPGGQLSPQYPELNQFLRLLGLLGPTQLLGLFMYFAPINNYISYISSKFKKTLSMVGCLLIFSIMLATMLEQVVSLDHGIIEAMSITFSAVFMGGRLNLTDLTLINASTLNEVIFYVLITVLHVLAFCMRKMLIAMVIYQVSEELEKIQIKTEIQKNQHLLQTMGRFKGKNHAEANADVDPHQNDIYLTFKHMFIEQKFMSLWQQCDPYATGLIPYKKLLNMIHKFIGCFGITSLYKLLLVEQYSKDAFNYFKIKTAIFKKCQFQVLEILKKGYTSQELQENQDEERNHRQYMVSISEVIFKLTLLILSEQYNRNQQASDSDENINYQERFLQYYENYLVSAEKEKEKEKEKQDIMEQSIEKNMKEQPLVLLTLISDNSKHQEIWQQEIKNQLYQYSKIAKQYFESCELHIIERSGSSISKVKITSKNMTKIIEIMPKIRKILHKIKFSKTLEANSNQKSKIHSKTQTQKDHSFKKNTLPAKFDEKKDQVNPKSIEKQLRSRFQTQMQQ